MKWFKRDKKNWPMMKPSIEIVANHRASKDMVRRVNDLNRKLNDVLVEDVTLKIYLSAGGNIHER